LTEVSYLIVCPAFGSEVDANLLSWLPYFSWSFLLSFVSLVDRLVKLLYWVGAEVVDEFIWAIADNFGYCGYEVSYTTRFIKFSWWAKRSASLLKHFSSKYSW